MKTHALYPMMFHPLYKDFSWGGTTIARRYNRAHTPRPCAESWELSALPGAESLVANGPLEGIGLDVLAKTFGPALLGTKAPDPERFPLLVKLIDAHAPLSGPDAAPCEPQARELWYLLDATPGATLQAGSAPDGTCQAFPATPGDLFMLPAGTPRAIGPGNLLFLIRACLSPTADRALPPAEPFRAPLHTALHPHRDLQHHLSTPAFTFGTLSLTRTRTLHTTAQSFMILFCAAGKTTLSHSGPHPLTLLPGDTVLVPPQQALELHPLAPGTHLLLATL